TTSSESTRARTPPEPDATGASPVVEVGGVKPEDRALTIGGGARGRFGGHVVHLGRRADALGEVAAAVVHLQEASAASAARGRAAVPGVGCEQRDVAGPSTEEHGRTAVVRQRRIGEPIGRW